MKASIKPTIEVIEELFETFNSKFYNDELKRPVLTVSSDTSGGAYGWCTTYKAWEDDQDGHYEINISAEHLNRPIIEVCGTLLHEMVHLYQLSEGVKGVSRGGTYHNTKFKNEALSRGLLVEHDDKYGWTRTMLNEESFEFVESLGIIDFKLHRLAGKVDEKVKKTKKTKSRKYICPECGQSFTSTKELYVMCGDCQVNMEVILK